MHIDRLGQAAFYPSHAILVHKSMEVTWVASSAAFGLAMVVQEKGKLLYNTVIQYH